MPISGVEMSTSWVFGVSPSGAVGELSEKTVKDEPWREIEPPVTNIARKQDWFDLRPFVTRKVYGAVPTDWETGIPQLRAWSVGFDDVTPIDGS